MFWELPLKSFQLLFDLCSRDLSVANGCLDGRRASERDLPQIGGSFFKCPSSRNRSVGEIIAQIMKANIGNLGLLICRRLLFERTKPVMQTSFSESCISL